jgi:hypothetical protein
MNEMQPGPRGRLASNKAAAIPALWAENIADGCVFVLIFDNSVAPKKP